MWEAARRGQVGAVVAPRGSPSPVPVLGTAGGGDPERGGWEWDGSPVSGSWETSGVHREGGWRGVSGVPCSGVCGDGSVASPVRGGWGGQWSPR